MTAIAVKCPNCTMPNRAPGFGCLIKYETCGKIFIAREPKKEKVHNLVVGSNKRKDVRKPVDGIARVLDLNLSGKLVDMSPSGCRVVFERTPVLVVDSVVDLEIHSETTGNWIKVSSRIANVGKERGVGFEFEKILARGHRDDRESE